ncbi:hypothetical protein chiPu_0031466, partial [Chiloscyllium punctatum]|nr:hypothetical protein [Chiloscyllium punctatum]
ALRQELCKASPEQTVEMLRAPRDPLVIQVLRRSPRCKGQASGHELQLVDNGTQTEISFEHIMALGKEHAPSPPVIQLEPYPLTEL